MPTSPSNSGAIATQRPELAGSLMEFDLAASRQGFIGTQVLPVTEVGKPVGNYGVIPIEQLLKRRDTKRSGASGYNRGDWTFDDAAFACLEYGAEEPIDDNFATVYRDYFDAEVIAAQRARDAVLREMEIRIATAVFNATTFTSQTTSITNEWDDFSNAVPITDVDTAVKAVAARAGIWPNALVINRLVAKNLKQCDQVKDAIASTGAGDSVLQGRVTDQQLAQAFDIDRVIIAGSSTGGSMVPGTDTAYEGQSTTAVGQIWSNEYAMVAVIAETNDIQEPCLGRTFHYAEDGSEIGGTFETYREESIRGDVVRIRNQVDEVIVYTALGQLLDNVTT
jgi:hypothetical protein